MFLSSRQAGYTNRQQRLKILKIFASNGCIWCILGQTEPLLDSIKITVLVQLKSEVKWATQKNAENALRSWRFQFNSSNHLSNILSQCKAMGFQDYIQDTTKKFRNCGVPAPMDRLDDILFVPAIIVTADHPFGSLSHAMSTQCSRRCCRIDHVRLGFTSGVYVMYFLVTIWTKSLEETLLPGKRWRLAVYSWNVVIKEGTTTWEKW